MDGFLEKIGMISIAFLIILIIKKINDCTQIKR